MTAVSKLAKLVRFCLAFFLWAHALFLINVHPLGLSRISTWLHLTSGEAFLAVLLLVFSFVGSTSFWRGVANICYIYFFPFVLVFYLGLGVIFALVQLARRLNPKPASAAITAINATGPPQTSGQLNTINAGAADAATPRKTAAELFAIARTPSKRFSLLWGFLLLIAVHKPILWFALAV